MAADYQFDSVAEWQTGEHVSCHEVDPSGKLSCGISPETLAENVSENNLSVYLRCREGSGIAIENVGSAGNGTLTPGTWKTRDDGRHYIQGGTVNVPYHADMKVATLDDNDDETSSYDWSAQIRVRFSSIAAAIFMQRSNRFQLGMDANGKPYVKNYYHISRVYNNQITYDAAAPLAQGDWFYLSNSNLVNGSVVLTNADGTSTGRTYEVNNTYGKIKFTSGGNFSGTLWVDYMHHEDSGWSELLDDTALEVDTWYTIGATCTGGSLILYVNHEGVASLSSDYSDNDPETDLVAGFVGDWDAVMYSGNTSSSNRVSFPSSGSWEKTITLAGDRAARYLEMNVSLSDEHLISVSMAFADDVDDLPYVKSWSYSRLINGYNKIFPPMDGLYHGSKMLVAISLSEGDYDREAVLVDYLKIHLREPATPIEEQMESPYEDLTIEDVTAEDLSALIQQVQRNRVVIKDLYRITTRLKESRRRGRGGGGGGGGYRSITEEDLPAAFRLIPITLNDLTQHINDLHWTLVHAIQYVEEGRRTNTSTIFANQSRIATLENAGYATETWVTTQISTHAALDTGVHGAGASTLATALDIANHEISATAHGSVEVNFGNHKDATTAVHGVGASNIASQSWVTSAIATHEGWSGAHGSIETLFANHKDASNSVHGVSGAGNAIAALIDIDAMISTHSNDTTNVHGITNTANLATESYADSAVSTHNSDTTAVHGIANTANLATKAYANAAVNTHNSDTTSVHGITNTANLATSSDVATAITNHELDCANYA